MTEKDVLDPRCDECGKPGTFKIEMYGHRHNKGYCICDECDDLSELTPRPIVVKGPLPGEGVDEHLKRFGHLPNTLLCDERGTCKELLLLMQIAKAVGSYYNSEAQTDQARATYKRMVHLYKEWCQDFRHIPNPLLDQFIKEIEKGEK